jgi:hypothetical protein
LIHKLQSYFSYGNPLLATTCGTRELLNALLKKVAKSNIGSYALANFDKIWSSNYFLHDMGLYIKFGGSHSKLFFTLQCFTWGIQYMGSFSVNLRSITTLDYLVVWEMNIHMHGCGWPYGINECLVQGINYPCKGLKTHMTFTHKLRILEVIHVKKMTNDLLHCYSHSQCDVSYMLFHTIYLEHQRSQPHLLPSPLKTQMQFT